MESELSPFQMFRLGENAFFEGAFFAKDKDVADFVQLIRNRVQPVSCMFIIITKMWLTQLHLNYL